MRLTEHQGRDMKDFNDQAPKPAEYSLDVNDGPNPQLGTLRRIERRYPLSFEVGGSRPV